MMTSKKCNPLFTILIAILLQTWSSASAFVHTKIIPCRRRLSALEVKSISNSSERKGPTASNRKELIERNLERYADKVISSRYVALITIMHPRKNTSVSNVLEANKQFLKLDRRNKSFTRMLVATVERRIGQIDSIIDDFLNQAKSQKKNKFNLVLRSALRIGVAQLVFLNTPSHAAISETVEVVRTYGLVTSKPVPEPLIKFVNAVLRNVNRNIDDVNERFSPVCNMVPWFRQRLHDDWGAATTIKICEQYMDTPHYLDLSFKTHDNNFIHALLDSQNITHKILENGSTRLENVNAPVTEIPGYSSGDWWVQSASASTPALALISSLKDLAKDFGDLTVGDVCAAPGGKTAQLLSSGLRVVAVESSARRVRRLGENLDRLKLAEKCIIKNCLGQSWLPEGHVDGILLDAPCSATGTGIRRPDILQKPEDDIFGLLKSQRELCEHCIDNVLNKGGILVYSTCSIFKEESEEQVQKLLDRSEGARVRTIPFRQGEIGGFDDAIDENGWLRVLPGCLDGELKKCDGFFVARLEVI